MALHLYHPRAGELLGYLPMIFLDTDARPAKEQANQRYSHGGGWHPLAGWKMDDAKNIHYPGDPVFRPIAMMDMLSGEKIYLYEMSWVAIVQPDGSYEVARMD